MSDDEGPGDYVGDDLDEGLGLEEDAAVTVDGDETDAAESVAGDDATAEEAPPVDIDDFEPGDAAGTDEEESDDAEAPEFETEDNLDPLSKATSAKNAKIDPVLRYSNKSRIVKVVDPDQRITDNRLQRSEAAYILATRATQIADTATAFTDAAGLHDPVAIAYKELYDRRCPLILRREIGIGSGGEKLVEEWDVRTMVLPAIPPPK